jgi:hypothetical protein
VLRRVASFCALLAVLAAPSVTSTRFFCRYTGLEIFGCDEGAPRNAQVRAQDCCDQRTFRAVQALKASPHELLPMPAAVAEIVAAPWPSAAPGDGLLLAARTSILAAGPPAFLAHRALLL